MALTKSDFEKYRVNEVLARRDDADAPYSYLNLFVEEKKRYEDAGDETGREIYHCLCCVASMELEPDDYKAPLKPQWQRDGGRAPIPEDISEEHLGFLATVADDDLEIHMRARIADILWLRKRDYQYARLAHKSYLATVDLDKPTCDMLNHVLRARQIAKQLNNSGLQDEANQKALLLAEKYKSHVKIIVLWAGFLMKIAENNDKDREEILERLWQEALKNENDSQDLVVNPKIYLWKCCADLSKGKQQQEALQKAIDGLVERAERHAYSRYYIGAVDDIYDALKLHEKVDGKSEQFEELQNLLYKYQEKGVENIPMNTYEREMGQEFTDAVNALAKREMDRIKGSTLSRALEKLAKMSHSRDVTVQSRIFDFISPIWPVVLQINKEHDEKLINAEELENIFSECDFIPKQNLRTFAYAMMAGLKSDLVAVAHVLPPQIEKAFREILRSKEIATRYMSGKMSGDEKPLRWILQQRAITELLDEYVLRDLDNLLVEKHTGLNLRNEVAHGEWADESFFTENNRFDAPHCQIMYLWWLALHLCFTIKKDDTGNMIYQVR